MSQRSSLIARYLVIGILAYGLELASLYVLHHLLHWLPVRSVAVSFWVGTISAFLLQKFVTFRNYDRQPHTVGRQMLTYGLLVAWNYSFTLLIVHTLEHAMPVYILRSITIIIVTSWNFLLYQFIFRQRHDPKVG